MRFLYTLTICAALASCAPIMKTLYGIGKPDVETAASIRKKALKAGLDTSGIVTVSSEAFLRVLRDNGIPNAAIYNRQGRYIEYRQTDTSCNAGLFQFIPALRADGVYAMPDSLPLQKEWEHLRDLNGLPLAPPKDADYTVLIYWTTWAGRLNKDHVKVWEEQARANTHCTIRVVKVNLDVQGYYSEVFQKQVLEAVR
jgi:hypothetical protein